MYVKHIRYSTDQFITKCHQIQGQTVVIFKEAEMMKPTKSKGIGEQIKVGKEKNFLECLAISNSLTLAKSYSLDKLDQFPSVFWAQEGSAAIPRFVISKAIEQAQKSVLIEGQNFTLKS